MGANRPPGGQVGGIDRGSFSQETPNDRASDAPRAPVTKAVFPSRIIFRRLYWRVAVAVGGNCPIHVISHVLPARIRWRVVIPMLSGAGFHRLMQGAAGLLRRYHLGADFLAVPTFGYLGGKPGQYVVVPWIGREIRPLMRIFVQIVKLGGSESQ